MKEKRGFWFLLSGLGLGLALGMGISWGLAPVQFTETTPASLVPEFKDDYRFMIASAYKADSDLPRAQARLGTLLDHDPIKALGEQAQRMLTGNLPMDEVQLIADLSSALQNQPTPAPSPSPEISLTAASSASPPPEITQQSQTPTSTQVTSQTPTLTQAANLTPAFTMTATIQETSTSTPKPIATIPVRPTQTVTATPAVPFELLKQSTVCNTTHPGLLEVFLTNSAGKPAAGIELVITWFNGEEHFFTGLKPELGLGYADFEMSENVEYALSLSGGNTRVTGLSLEKCSNPQGGKYPGGIRLDLKQP